MCVCVCKSIEVYMDGGIKVSKRREVSWKKRVLPVGEYACMYLRVHGYDKNDI